MLTTCPDSARPQQRGFTLVSMIFILVVLAVLGVAMARFSMRQQLGSASELAAAQALQAANAGLEWASFQLLRNPAPPAAAPGCFAANNIGLGGALAGFVVSINCTQSSDSDGGTALTFYNVTATACNAPTGGVCPAAGAVQTTYVERQLTRRLVR